MGIIMEDGCNARRVMDCKHVAHVACLLLLSLSRQHDGWHNADTLGDFKKQQRPAGDSQQMPAVVLGSTPSQQILQPGAEIYQTGLAGWLVMGWRREPLKVGSLLKKV